MMKYIEKKVSIDHNIHIHTHIHDDLSFSILSKLPLKSLKRFSCVRKSWSILFENPNFMNKFITSESDSNSSNYSCLLLRQIQPSLLIMPYSYSSDLHLLSGDRFENKLKLDWPPPFLEDSTVIHILGPVIDGIVCLYLDRGSLIVLWNPATHESKVLPPSFTEAPVLYEVGKFQVHGFGYDHVSGDYKVIRHVYYRIHVSDDEDDEMQGVPNMEGVPNTCSRSDVYEIYSLRTNSWTKLDLDYPCHLNGYAGTFVYMKGVCHWLDLNGYQKDYLLSFDLSNEILCTTPLPFDVDDTFNPECLMRHLMLLNQHIALISNYFETTTFYISILGEPGVKESWTKLFILGPLPCIEHPIGEGKNGDLFFRRKDDELVRFNLSTHVIDELGIKGQLHCCHVVNYKESFLPIGQILD